MKKLIILLSITLFSTLANAQVDSLPRTRFIGIDTSQFTGYKVCMSCGENWKTTSGKINSYATGQSKSQQNTLNANSLAAQTLSSSKRFVRGIAATVVGVFVAGVTMAIISKTNQSANALFYH
jgi:hypothetical protein